jgi:hypothetical protein
MTFEEALHHVLGRTMLEKLALDQLDVVRLRNFWDASAEQEREHPDPAFRWKRPTIVCLCGSGRFMDAFNHAEFSETLAGKIVLTIGCNTKDIARCEELKPYKPALDELHKRKIDLADEVLILNVGNYIGDSTRSELEYAIANGKKVRWLEKTA